MKKLGLISIGLMLLLAPVLLWPDSVSRAAGSVRCRTATTLRRSVWHTASSPRCYRFSVPRNSDFLRVTLNRIAPPALICH